MQVSAFIAKQGYTYTIDKSDKLHSTISKTENNFNKDLTEHTTLPPLTMICLRT